MGTGWRRAFCTTITRDRKTSSIAEKEQSSETPIPSPKRCSKLGLFSTGSNPSTPRLRCRTSVPNSQKSSSNEEDNQISPKLHCKTTNNTPKSTTKSPKTLLGSNPSSPRSPFSIFKNSLRLSRSSCGICLQSVKTGQGTAIYTAECSHAFHFPCIASHVRKQSRLICPVCNVTWRDVPLLAIHKLQENHSHEEPEMVKQASSSIKQAELKPTISYKTSLDVQQSYDDDEPLVSPTAGSGIIPIPESDEKEEVEEFQGFFVNPTSSSSDESLITGGNSRSVEVTVMPEVAVVSVVGRTHQSWAVVLKVKAPPPPPPAHNSSRARIDLVTVLDVSGSMNGAKLQMLKRAMRLVISSLGSADRLSIIAFSATPKRLLPLTRMTVQGQRTARRIIDRLACSQGASFGEALRKATKILEDRRERNPVASIMLLSDGHDDKAHNSTTNQRQGSSHVSSTRFAHIEIPVHSAGIGEKYGYSHEPAEDAFTKCVGGILSVVVQDLRVQLGFATGSDPAEISAVYLCNGRPTIMGSGVIRLGDLYAEEERELLVEVTVPTASIGSHHVLSVKCCYKDPATQEVIYGTEKALIVPRPQAVRSSAPKIERLRNLFITARAIAESRRLIEQNDMASAFQLLSSARALLKQNGSVYANDYVRGLEAELTELQWRGQYRIEQQQMFQRRRGNESEMAALVDENGEPLTPTSSWRAAEQLAKVAAMRKSMNRVSDLHGFENARF